MAKLYCFVIDTSITVTLSELPFLMASLAILLHASWKRAETGSSCTSSRPAKVSGWAITTFTMPSLQPGSLLFSLLRDIRERAWQCCQIKKQTNGTQRINYIPVLFSVFWEVSSLFSVCGNKKGEQRYHFSERTFSTLCHKNPKITLKSNKNKLLNYKKATRHQLQAWENESEGEERGFSFATDCLERWRQFSIPTIERCKTEPMKSRITFQ